jgi:hypothetical protein
MAFNSDQNSRGDRVMSRAEGAIPSLEGAGGAVAILNPLAADIAGVLLDLGGAAHGDLVLAHVAKRRGLYRPSDALRQEVDEAFATYCQGAGDPRAANLFYLPHGAQSHRWALTDWAHELLRAKASAGRDPEGR